MDISKIPHRKPFLFIDHVSQVTENSITAHRVIDSEEFYFSGHYPGNPIFPGVLCCECMFQAGALLMSEICPAQQGVPVVTRINGARFKRMIRPGDSLCIEVTLKEIMAAVYFFKGKVSVNNKLCADCEFSCTIMGSGLES